MTLTLTLSTLGLWACCSPSTRSLIWAARRNVAGQALVPLLVAKREGILDLDRYNAMEVIEVLDDDAAVVRAGYVVPAEQNSGVAPKQLGRWLRCCPGKRSERMTSERLRLGFPVKVMGKPDLKSNDARRWAQNPHLSVSLEYVDAILDYCDRHDIRMYRMSSDLAPYATHPDLPQFHGMVRESAEALRAIGDKARRLDIRLSFHPSQYIVLNSPDPELVRKSVWDLSSQAEMLDLMGLGDEAVLVIHVGGAYGDKAEALRRWVDTWHGLPEPVRRRLVLENDDVRFSASDVLRVHEQTGVRLIFDHQHFLCLNPDGLEMRSTVEQFLASWSGRARPKLHFSSPRTEMRVVKRKGKDGKTREAVQAPVWTGHADFVHPFEFIGFMRAMAGLEFDVMLEAKAKDLALIRLRLDLVRYAPEVAARFGLAAKAEAALEAEEEALMETGDD